MINASTIKVPGITPAGRIPTANLQNLLAKYRLSNQAEGKSPKTTENRNGTTSDPTR